MMIFQESNSLYYSISSICEVELARDIFAKEQQNDMLEDNTFGTYLGSDSPQHEYPCWQMMHAATPLVKHQQTALWKRPILLFYGWA